MKEGLIYPNGQFQPTEEIVRRLEMEQRGFITTRPQFTKPPMIEQFLSRQEQVKEPKPNLKFYFQNEPIVNMIFDGHWGEDCDYNRQQAELNAIMGKRDSFTILGGDMITSFAFNPAQMEQIEQVPRQIQLASEIIDKLIEANRLLLIVPGNHEAWMKRQGVNIYELLTKGRVPVVYGVNYVELNVQGTPYKMTIAHQLRGHSMYNPVHPQLREGNFGAEGADIIVAGHTHRRGFSVTSKKEHGGNARQVLNLSCGTYKFSDEYTDRNGYHKQQYPEMGGYAVKLRKQKGNYEVGDILEMNQ